MKNNKIILFVLTGLLIAGGIIAWLMLGGNKPVTIKPGDGITAQINASLKNSVLKREKDGKLLWEFSVSEVVSNKSDNTAYLHGIKGKVYRSDGSYIDISADKGMTEISKNKFSLEGSVKAILNTGGELYADKIVWDQDKNLVTANGKFKMRQGDYTAVADSAETTSAFQYIKLRGNAKVEKGGE